MKNSSDFQKTVQCRFESCLKKVVRHVVKDYQKKLKRLKRKKHFFVNFQKWWSRKFVIYSQQPLRYTEFARFEHVVVMVMILVSVMIKLEKRLNILKPNVIEKKGCPNIFWK